ncbi:MAG: homoserine O-acetyltransferase [Acidimicrobiales bacterium]
MTTPERPLRRAAPTGEPLPATGAWREGDPVAWRNFVTVGRGRKFALEGGGLLGELQLAFEYWGELNAAADNAILVCHALTGDAHAKGPSGHGQPTEGWWNDMIGPGRPLDTDRFFVVCANVLGGCQGTTGPSSPHPDDGLPWGSRFPVITIRDIVRSQALLANDLGIGRWAAVVGGSMGGMQALEWAVMYPERVGALVSIASAAAASPLQIGWSEVGRLAIAQDPRWRQGDYYDAEPGDGPAEGLMLARRVAQLHYRSDDSLEQRFGRAVVGKLDRFAMWDRFQIEGYLDYHGQKLARRFDANSYLLLNKAMDLHDIGRDRGGLDLAAARVQCPTLVVSIDSDVLYTPRQQLELADILRRGNAPLVEFATLESIHGHDGFLIEFPQLGPIVERFVDEQAKA